jgi:hypothetical protein
MLVIAVDLGVEKVVYELLECWLLVSGLCPAS